ncbi:hypothetical protein Y026_5431 [Burkholderia pseudomallei TSV28]|nr:hypothetical protein Y026_5431 [Burkholderia pseudomallei TSV28]
MRFSASNREFSASFSSLVFCANSSWKAVILPPLPQIIQYLRHTNKSNHLGILNINLKNYRLHLFDNFLISNYR